MRMVNWIKPHIQVVIVFLLNLLLATHLSAETVLRLTNGEWRPLFSKEYKEFGLFSHMITRAFELSEIKVQYGFYPWARGLKLAEKSQDWDGAVGWSKTSDREQVFYFSDPVMEVSWVFFHRKDTNFEWKDYDTLSKYSLGATQGYFYSDDFKLNEEKKQIKVIRVADDLMGLRLLMSNRIDAFPLTAEVGYDLLHSKYPIAKGIITNHKKAISTQPLHLLISKKVKDGDKLIDLFNENLKKLYESGELQKMREESYQGKYHPNPSG